MARFRVFILEYGMNRLTDGTRKAARKKVEDELNKVAATSKKQQVKEGFAVSWPDGGSTAIPDDLAATDFVAYVMPKRETPSIPDLVKKYVDIPSGKEKELMDKVAAPLKSEGGANVKMGDKNISFVSVDLYDEMTRGPMMDDGEMGRAESYAGEKLGEFILHELGHGMGTDHDHGIMEAHPQLNTNYDDPSPVQGFTNKCKGQIMKTLERLAGAAR
jgi:hypothetical protein